jgi:hypothetical protein
MFLNMDMEKAFDKMEWCFLLAIMRKLGFDDTWINWIESSITSSSFSILINGSPFVLFSPTKGLRQRDPLSPFLFILGSEVFSRLMFKEESLGHIKGLKIARNTSPIHHLLFADDLLIFRKASLQEACWIKSYLNKYCSWSGQSIIALKSSIRFSKNTAHTISTSILNILPFNPTHPPPYILAFLFSLAIPNVLLSKVLLTEFKTSLKVGDQNPSLKQAVWSSSNQ